MASTISDRLSHLRSAGVNTGVSHTMFRLVTGVVGLLVLLLLLPTTVTYIHPGHVGIVISRTGGGVEPTPLAAGLHTRNPLTTGIEEYPIYMQTLVLAKSPTEGSPENEEINVNSVEGQPISLDVAMSFELNAMQVPELYSTFRNDIDFIQHTYVKQTIRQALQTVIGSEAIADILGPKKAEVVTRTQDMLEQNLKPYGFVVKQFTINEIRAPQTVIDAINAKNVMQQAALTSQNELQKKQFQATGDSIEAAGHAKAILAEAEAQAKANQLLSQSITPNLVSYEMAKRWNGQMPQVAGSAMPMIQLPKP
jgi:regulator of protease activity HflC (stomatin/prohibitin superfamily)